MCPMRYKCKLSVPEFFIPIYTTLDWSSENQINFHYVLRRSNQYKIFESMFLLWTGDFLDLIQKYLILLIGEYINQQIIVTSSQQLVLEYRNLYDANASAKMSLLSCFLL